MKIVPLAILAATWYFSRTPGVESVYYSYLSINQQLILIEIIIIKYSILLRTARNYLLFMIFDKILLGIQSCQLLELIRFRINIIIRQLIKLIIKLKMHFESVEKLYNSISDASPSQLKQVIEVLINKSKILINKLE